MSDFIPLPSHTKFSLRFLRPTINVDTRHKAQEVKNSVVIQKTARNWIFWVVYVVYLCISQVEALPSPRTTLGH